jgi:hypothetical protein
MSVLPRISDVSRTSREVCNVPKADIQGLFDYLAGSDEQRKWNGKIRPPGATMLTPNKKRTSLL